MSDAHEGGRLVGGRYLLGAEVGRGGMGVVWRAEDQVLGRAVAVKQVHLQPGLTDDERHSVAKRVMREARAAASLNHVGAVTVYDVVEDGEQAYIVMELVEAPTLADVVRERGALPTAEVVRVGTAVCDVLTVAHERGIVHRDLKPANVLVTDERVKLTDFGIATVKDDPRLTSTGIVLGSPSYIAPEQARGHDVTEATDVWGLGATLYYAATGVPPFDRGEAIATLTAVAHDDLVLDERTGAFGPLLERMLAKDPQSRPTLAQVRDALTEVAAGGAPTLASALVAPTLVAPAVGRADATTRLAPVGLVAPTGPPPMRAPERRRRGWLVPAALAAVAVVGVALAAPWQDGDRGKAPTGTLGEPTRTASPRAVVTRAAEPSRTGSAVVIDLPLISGLEGSYTNDKAGYTVRYPAAWQRVSRGATITDFVEPGTGRYLRVDWTADPKGDPKKDWERQSQSFAARHEAYEEIRIESTEFREQDAAIWEYRYAEGGAALHASNLAIVTEERGYALNFQTREGDWADSQDLFDRMRDSFTFTTA